jgi:hypothetical protein
MNGLSASTIIVSIMAAIGMAPGPLASLAANTAAPAMTAARAAILPDGAILAADGRSVVFRQA